MSQPDLLKKLDYDGSPNFLRAGGGEFESALAYGHIFRLAAKKRKLKGVYTLRSPRAEGATPVIPVVYVCEADSDLEADQTHRLVWNQDVVPFLIVQTPRRVRVYSGFQHEHRKDGTAKPLRVFEMPTDLAALVENFGAEAIDSGALWGQWGQEVRPEGRVDWRLLESLTSLDRWLQGEEAGLAPHISHALIGKYVYLHYLRDRDILSDRKLKSWGLTKEDIFGRRATLGSFQRLTGHLDQWLNGAVFPIDFSSTGAPTEKHLQWVAGTFGGDEVREDRSWQLHLDFNAYDFSYIPIETLSVVYEQFLHTTLGTETSRGKEAGAYYTPIPVVNFMLSEVSERVPLRPGMKVLDPSCGSGAFLVQCYRRLIEATFPPGRSNKPSPVALRELLEQSIFGIDRDADACGITELSLAITLLDYIDTPDLENDKRVKLPSLRNRNIFHADFFAAGPSLIKALGKHKFDWVVGNPPWKKLVSNKISEVDRPTWESMDRQKHSARPIGDNQVAQAFVWESGELVAANGEVALLLPGMTLFEDPSRSFRASFLRKFQVVTVANFSNLTEVLFAGRSRVPAAAFFYRRRKDGIDPERQGTEYIRTYSPMVANQEPTRPVGKGRRTETWSLTLNSSEVRDILLSRVVDGDARPWKFALWGSHLDEALLDRLRRRFLSLRDLEARGDFIVSEGLQLRKNANPRDENAEAVEHLPEVTGKSRLNPSALKEARNVFVFPALALENVGAEISYARKGRASLPLRVSNPPHVIIGAARHYAVYTEDYLIVPARQIGLIAKESNKDVLKAVSLFLSSDFAFYHQFFVSTQFGIKRDVATLDALRDIPLPVATLSASDLLPWKRLHARLVAASRRQWAADEGGLFSIRFAAGEAVEPLPALLKELNRLVADCLGLRDRERALIEDLVHVRLELNDGKLGPAAVSPPDKDQMRGYAERLKADLDTFIEGELARRHQVAIIFDNLSAMIQVDLTNAKHAKEVIVLSANAAEAATLRSTRARLRKQWSQWVYFDRDLRVFEGTRIYLLKPMQRFHWTESQAMLDAGEILAETLAGIEASA